MKESEEKGKRSRRGNKRKPKGEEIEGKKVQKYYSRRQLQIKTTKKTDSYGIDNYKIAQLEKKIIKKADSYRRRQQSKEEK